MLELWWEGKTLDVISIVADALKVDLGQATWQLAEPGGRSRLIIHLLI